MRFLRQKLVVAALVMGVTSSASASTIDLTTAGASGSFTVGLDFFQQISPSSTGTGVIDPIVRITDARPSVCTGGNPCTFDPRGEDVEGYNTDARPVSFDELTDTNYTKSLLLSAVPEVTLADGFVYYQFLLDINQTGASPELSLNELQIFFGNAGNLSGSTKDANGTLTAFGANATLIYDMDATGVNNVLLDFSLNSGSGSGDMFFYLRKPAGVDEVGKYLYLYSHFGYPNAAINNDGFEEWSILKCPVDNPTCFNSGSDSETPVPEPGSMFLLGSGLVLAASRLRRKKA